MPTTHAQMNDRSASPPLVATHRIFGVAVAHVMAYCALIALMPSGLPHRAVIADAAFFPIHPLAGWLLWRAAEGSVQRSSRSRGLRALAWSQFIGTVNTLVWVLTSAGVLAKGNVWYEIVGGAMTACTVIGVILLVPRATLAGSVAVVPLVDFSLLAIAGFAAGFHFVGLPILQSGADSPADFLAFTVITGADVFCALVALGAWAFPGGRVRGVSGALLFVAFAGSSVLDVIIEVGSSTGSYVSGHWSDIAGAVVVFAFGAIGYVERVAPDEPSAISEATARRWRALLPFAAMALALTPAILSLGRVPLGRATLVALAFAVAFVVLMQVRFLLLDRSAERAVTERLALERDLRLAQQFESLGRYAAAVAHDFNNVLAALQGQAELMRTDAGVAKSTQDELEHMRGTITHGTTLTRRLLMMARGVDAPEEPVDLGHAVQVTTTMLRRLLPSHVRLDAVLPHEPMMVMLRPGEADQLLLNLVVNARDAMPRGGRITVRIWADAARVRLEVEDTGEGIPPDVRARIFEPFFTTKTEGKGTGLGLSTVQSIAEHAGGEVELWSEVGRGTRFSITFPQAGAGGA